MVWLAAHLYQQLISSDDGSFSSPYMSGREKFLVSEEAQWEIEGLQHYVAALAQHDLMMLKPVYLSAALDLPSNLSDAQSLQVGAIADLQAFWRPSVHDVHASVTQMPLHWGVSHAIAVSGFVANAGCDLIVPSTEVPPSPTPMTLFLTSSLRGGMPSKQPPAAGWCATRHTVFSIYIYMYI